MKETDDESNATAPTEAIVTGSEARASVGRASGHGDASVQATPIGNAAPPSAPGD